MSLYLSIVFLKKLRKIEKFQFPAMNSILRLVIQKAMAIAFEIGIRDLLTEFLTDAFRILRLLQTAGAIAALSFEPFLDLRNKRGVFIQSDSHGQFSPFVNNSFLSKNDILFSNLRTNGIENVRNPSSHPVIFKIRSSMSKQPLLSKN